MPGSSDVLGCSSLENSPYREHEMFAMFDMYYPPPSGPHPDNWFVQQHPGNYANNDGILLKREFGASQFDKLDSSGENFYVILAKGSGETQTTDGTLFQHWTDFDDYVNERNGNMDLVWQPGEHPSLGTQYPDAVVIGSTLGTLFFILDDGYGFPGIDHDLIVLGGIMTTGGIDIRDYGSRVRLSTDDNRVYDWWAGRVATWYDQETSPLPPAGFTYEPDGVRHLYVFQPNTTLPALACAKDLLIVNRAYSTVIAGWPSASGTFVYSKERILWYNPIPTDRSQYKVRVTGAMHAKYMYLYGSFAIAYEPTVQNQQMMTETVPDSIEIIEVQKGVQLDEAYYKGLADAT